jgi:uncharacterized OB-fold protein
MSAPMTVSECRQCGYVAYPPRILCPVCAGSEWKRRLAATGIVTEVTVRRPVFKRRQLPWGNWLDQEAARLACVQSDAGVRIVARVPEGVEVGDRVHLVSQASTAIALPGQVVEAQPDRSPQPHVGAPLSDWPGRE